MRNKLLSSCTRTTVLGWLLLVASAAQADDSAQAQRLLTGISEAARTTSYEGTFIYRHRGNLEALRVVHKVSEEGVRERLYALTGPAREIVRDNEKVSCYLPDDREVVIDRLQLQNPLNGAVPKDVDGLLPHYRLDLIGDGRVAGREAVQIGVWPRDEYRYGYRFWVDRATGLLLRSDLMSGEGEPIEQLMFTELLAPAEISDAALQPSVEGYDFSWRRLEEGPTATVPTQPSAWAVEELPAGFELAVHEMRRLPGSDEPVEHLLFSDGLTNVSVYIEKINPEESFSGHSRVGAVSAYGKAVDTHQVTAVGEVPQITVETIAEAVRLSENGSAQAN